MIQKEKIRGVGYFLMALAAGLLPFAAPDACAQALREGLALCGGPSARRQGSSGSALRRLGGCCSSALWAALPPQQVPPPGPSAPGSSLRGRPMRSFRPVSVPARPL